ncbi:hypothetical protein [Niallia taxi]|uniref:hypothetical protein n=1 Tax=Niallia taxi TaxID=2499688 RepID=UPI00300BC330
MLANVENINYMQDTEGFHIVVEFSKEPVETFNTQKEADEFILGYLYGWTTTEPMQHGLMFRTLVDIELKQRVKYEKRREILEENK